MILPLKAITEALQPLLVFLGLNFKLFLETLSLRLDLLVDDLIDKFPFRVELLLYLYYLSILVPDCSFLTSFLQEGVTNAANFDSGQDACDLTFVHGILVASNLI